MGDLIPGGIAAAGWGDTCGPGRPARTSQGAAPAGLMFCPAHSMIGTTRTGVTFIQREKMAKRRGYVGSV